MNYSHPLWQQLDKLFKSDRGWRWKLLAAFIVGTIFGLIGGLKVWFEDRVAMPLIVAPPIVGVLVAFVIIPFVIADTIERRTRDGQRVSPLMRLFFGPSGLARALRITLVSILATLLAVAPFLIGGK